MKVELSKELIQEAIKVISYDLKIDKKEFINLKTKLN